MCGILAGGHEPRASLVLQARGMKRHVREELVPPAIDGLEFDGEVLEVGPGFGPATEVLTRRAGHVTAIELDPVLAAALRDRLGDRAEIVHGDGTAMPFADASFSAATCFTMLHHVPSPDLQDRLFAEVRRVLRPGAPFVVSRNVRYGETARSYVRSGL
jgi:ubiquinone/menaquinone biosynthesis C-methylase UbiE